MTVYIAALILFLLAFTGLAAGVLIRRRGLRGGCGSSADTGRDCRCKSETGRNLQVEVWRNTTSDKEKTP